MPLKRPEQIIISSKLKTKAKAKSIMDYIRQILCKLTVE